MADSSLAIHEPKPEQIDILGVPVTLTSLPEAVRMIAGWCENRESRFVCTRDVHGIMLAQEDPRLLAIHRQADMVTPDGMPLVWVAKKRGFSAVSRVCGADLVEALCDVSQKPQLRHFFFGGKPGVAERMAAALANRFPGLSIAGCETPPFRAMTDDEDEATVSKIAATHPHIVWVGLSTPKQEYWMAQHVGRIPGATLIGVGAAFDFMAGEVKRAPVWMQRNGLEWLHRLLSEPRRLWRRYLVLAPMFLIRLAFSPKRR